MFGLSAGAALALGVGGGLLLSGGSSQPDTSGMNASAVQSAQVAADTLAWYKAKDAADKPLRDELGKRAISIADQQLASSKTNDALAADYANYNKTTFRPVEQAVADQAQNYNTPERRQAAADSAMADTNMAFDATNQARARQLAANGINPGSTRAMSVMQGQGVDQAVANAGAAYRARKGVESVGHAMQMDAASLGRNLPSAQATAAQNGIQAGNSSLSSATVPLNASNQAGAAMGQGFNTAINGYQTAGNLYGGAAKINLDASNASNSLYSGLGSAAGMFAGSPAGSAAIAGLFKSSKDLKTDIAPVSDQEALAATNATPVKKWRYDPAKMAQAGIQIPADAAGENIGPMAQDVNKTMGEGAAPGGTQLNMVSMNGINMKAIQAVDKKVEGLGKQVHNLASMIRSGKVQAGARA